jgi:antitoxin VapB
MSRNILNDGIGPENACRAAALTAPPACYSVNGMATMTKIIRQGNSQALRIPKDFRLPSKEVEIYRTGSGLMIIDPAERKGVRKALRALQEIHREIHKGKRAPNE